MSRWTTLGCAASLLALSACSGPAFVESADDEVTGNGSETSSGDEGPTSAPPQIVNASQVGTPGGLVFLLVDAPISDITLAIGGVDVEPRQFLFTDIAGALYRVPEDAEPGFSQLEVRWRHEDGAAATRELEIVAPRFVDVALEAGLGVTHDATGSPPECAQSHTGVAWGDYDDDGVPDVFVGNVGSGGTLHRGLGVLDASGVPSFTDATQAAGLTGVDSMAMAQFVDLEGDGDLDLFVGRRGYNRVFRNQLAQTGAATFVDATAELGLDFYSQRTMGVAFGDFDADDDLDLYVVNHAFCFPARGSEIRAEDHLYRNDGGRFVEQTHWLDSPVIASVGFSAAWVDVERDGDLDLIVINDDVGGDIGMPNALWRNDGPDEEGGWRLTDVSIESGVGLPGVNGMGLAYGDIDDDGFVDFSFTNIGSNVLLLGNGDGTFFNASEQAGIARNQLPWERRSTTWAAHMFDHDNDGDLELYFSGGRIKGEAPVPDAFLDNLGDGRFEERTWAAGVEDPAAGKASALVDFDRDGDWDVVTTAWAAPLRVYQNRMADRSSAHFVDIELRASGGNSEALGAIVTLEAGGKRRTCFHGHRPSLGAGGEATCHFGLGDVDRVDALTITWPDGTEESAALPAVDQRTRYVR